MDTTHVIYVWSIVAEKQEFLVKSDTKYTFCKYDKHPNEKYNISAKNALTRLGSVSNTENLLLSSTDGSTLSTKSLKDIYDAIEWARQDAKGHANTKYEQAKDYTDDRFKNLKKYMSVEFLHNFVHNKAGDSGKLTGKRVEIPTGAHFRKRFGEYYTCQNGNTRPGCNAHSNGYTYGTCANCSNCIDSRHSEGAVIYC